MGEMTHKAFGSSRILGGKLGRSRLLEACVPNELHRLWSVVDTSLEDAPMRTWFKDCGGLSRRCCDMASKRTRRAFEPLLQVGSFYVHGVARDVEIQWLSGAQRSRKRWLLRHYACHGARMSRT